MEKRAHGLIVLRLLAMLGALLASLPALAATVSDGVGGWSKAGPVEARLIAAVAATGDLAEVPLALELRLDPGWKTYWRTPGDAGLPPTFDWSASSNLERATHAFPPPHRFSTLGIETAGYDGAVTFPIRAVPRSVGAPLDLAAAVDLLVCSEICVPQRVSVALSLPAGPALPGAEANTVAQALARLPGDGTAAGIALRAIRAEGDSLIVEATGREPFVAPDLFPESEPPLIFGAPTVEFGEDDRLAVFRLRAAEPPPEGLAGRSFTLTLVDGRRAAELRSGPALAGAPAPFAPAPGGAGAGSGGLLPMLAVALLGGLILNLMPCVLPVLSLKLLSVVGHGGGSPRAVRAGFLASAAGILASFLLLAAAMAAVKAAGASVGWGIQFQQPLFLAGMAVLVTLFAANMLGLFEIALPAAVLDRVGGRESPGLGGAFATGALATLLATPCSAPFVGTAVGFALSRGTAEIVAVFAALGIGLALPYLLVAAVPGLARVLPRPGRWMLAVRRLMGAVLLLTAGWLLSIVAVQSGAPVALTVAGLLLALLLVLWVGRRWPGPARAAAAGALGLTALTATTALPTSALPTAARAPADTTLSAASAGIAWTAFDETAIPPAVASGRTVFVDVTAEWCITCIANERLVLHRDPVAERLGPAGGVVTMRADWTRPDERIAAFLARHGRYGIPFTMVYGPGAPAGIALPELLSPGTVLDALERAGGRAAASPPPEETRRPVGTGLPG